MTRRTSICLLLIATSAVWAGAQTFSNINGIRFVSQFSGSDLGAKINSAVANCGGPCNLYVDVPGTISTTPDVPAGYSITFSPGTYTLATTLKINHTHTVWNFGSATFNYSLDSGGQAVWIGKDIYGTATSCTTNTTTCTSCPYNPSQTTAAIIWSSGTSFSDVDPGDLVFFNGASYNAASSTATTICVLGTPGNISSAVDVGIFMGSNGNVGLDGPIVISNLNLHHAGTNSTSIDAVHMEAVGGVTLTNNTVTNFSGGASNAFSCIACISNRFTNLVAVGNATALFLDGKAIDGSSTSWVDSNENDFFGFDFVANTGGTNGAVQLHGRAASNRFIGGRYEGNTAGYAVLIPASVNCSGNVWYAPYFERNGNGTSGSADFLQQCGDNSVYDGVSTSGATNYPAFGYVAQNAGTLMNITNISMGGFYTTAFAYMTGSSGKLVRPSTGSISSSRGNAQQEDIQGNLTQNGIWATGYNLNSNAGFTGTKTAGSCVLTISGGIITNVSGC